MKKQNLKSEKGVTLISLTVYIIAMLVVLGIMQTISSFFYGNLNSIQDSAKYASEFDRFNGYIVTDVKSNTRVNANSTSKTIIFEDGTTYVYNQEDESIYRGQTKIATHVKGFEVSKKTITINNVDKDILTVKIIIGNSTKNLLNKQIDYTLKYW